MKKAKLKFSKSAKFFSALIRTAYLPSELPPAITSQYFSEFCRDQFDFLQANQTTSLKKNTNYETFTAPRPKSGRRNLALVHPIAQARLSLLLTEHRLKVRALIKRSPASLYQTAEDLKNARAFKGIDFTGRHSLEAKISSENPFVLSADISRFFYTIYTHSIPWAVIGKEKTKQWLTSDRDRLTKHWADKLDRAMQACQSQETFGIPVGPDTSRIIAEIIFAGIEGDPTFKSLLAGRSTFRIVDDFTIGFDNADEANRALVALRNALWQFNLQLNEEKTRIIPSVKIMRQRWELDHEAISISDVDVNEQSKQLARLFELTLHFCADSKTDTPALWTCRRILQLKNIKENFGQILDGMFRLTREFPRCMNYVATMLINNQDFCADANVNQRIERWCRSTIKMHIRHGHDFEVSWALVICGILKIKLRKSDLDGSNGLPSPTTLALLGLLKEKKLLEFSLSVWPWKAKLKQIGPFEQYWLPFYEAVLRGWTKEKALVAAIKSNPVLASMLAHNVTFLEDSIFDTARINIGKFRSGSSFITTAAGIERFRKTGVLRGLGGIRIKVEDLDY